MANSESDTVRGIAVPVTDDTTTVNLDRSDGTVLEALYRTIGCHLVDVVRLDHGIDMWVDDEGMITSEVNRRATLLAWALGLTTQLYFGDVVFASSDEHGETVSLSSDQEDLLNRLLNTNTSQPA